MTMSISQIGFEIVSKLDNYDWTISLLGKKYNEVTYWLLRLPLWPSELAAETSERLGFKLSWLIYLII